MQIKMVKICDFENKTNEYECTSITLANKGTQKNDQV